MSQNLPHTPSEAPVHTGLDFVLIAVSAAAGLIALLYLIAL